MQSKIFAIPSIAFVLFLSSGCTTQSSPSIEPPVKWQAHLVEANLPANFTPAVSERVYVPVYSQIYFEDPQRMLSLVGTLSIRNTDEHESLIIKSIRYYDTQGKLIASLVDKPVQIGPFATAEVVVPRTHNAGGSGANFIVDWMAGSSVTEPIIEAVMLSTGSSKSVSFTSRGEVISRSKKAPSTASPH